MTPLELRKFKLCPLPLNALVIAQSQQHAELGIESKVSRKPSPLAATLFFAVRRLIQVPSRQISLTVLFVSLASALCLAQFETRFINPLSPNPWGDTVADLNHDGNLDIVVTNCGRTYQISVMLGNGDGPFQPAVNYPLPNCADVPAVGDFNGDGNLDLAVSDSGSTGSVLILLGNGDGTFQPA